MASTTPERLREAAWTIVSQEGLRSATSRRITEMAGANLAAITYYYGSKDALVGDALVDQLRQWTAPLTDAFADQTTDADERVAAAIQTMLQAFATRRQEVIAILRALMTNDDLPGVGEAVTRWLHEFRAVVSAVMANHQARGLIPPEVDPEAMAGVFTAFGVGVITQAAVDLSPPDTGSVISQFLLLLQRPPSEAER
jgi:AcrR family transcriptional regulator